MTRITKLTATGFKSFAKKTELSFGTGFNCVIGPNGSGKSNIMDSLCFVLGKSSAKGMRAEKSANLIYNGGKKKNPLGSAEVSIYFDNSNKVFPLDSKEVKVSRIIKKSGQSIYKINDKKMTRQQVVDMLSSAKIDPNGHNIILQGDITHFASMKPLERRLILEEIAGISVFEDKKNKALSELEKVEEKLTEADILLTERNTHLRELKKERDQAKKYLDLKNKIKDNKATYLYIQIKEKEEKKIKAENLVKEIESKIEKINSNILTIKENIEDRKEEIYEINKTLEEKGEKEQIDLRDGISTIRTDLTEAKTRTETIRKELSKIDERKKQLDENIFKNNKRIENIFKEKNQIDTKIIKLEKQSSSLSKKSTPSADFTAKFNELANLRNISNGTFTNPSLERISSMNGFHGTISELGRVSDKYSLPLEVCAGARMKSVITKDDSCAEQCIKALKSERLGIITFLPLNKIKPKNTNPGLKSLTKLKGVHGLAKDLIKYNKKYENAFSNIFGSTLIVDDIQIARKIGIGRTRMVTLEGDLVETSGAMIGGYRRGTKIGFKQGDENDNKLLDLEQEIEFLRKGTSGLEEEKRDINTHIMEFNSENGALESQINMLSDENDRINKIVKDHNKEKEDFKSELKKLEFILKNEFGNLKESEKKEKVFYEKVKNLTNKRNKLTEEISKKENMLEVENEKIRKIEKKENELSIYRAKHIAELEGLQKEFEDYDDGKIRRNIKIEDLRKEISEFEKLVNNLGNINMKALEIYEELVEEHQSLVEKTSKIKSEKLDVLDMIEEIEKKKTGIFMETYNNINNKFKEIFNGLSTKGEASLVLENKEEPLEGGVDMVVKITNNKFIDIRSLSGGEKTLVTLAFIFSIQEHNPASFYILDEVDASLDKRNAEKLAKLFRKYSENAQYVVISHNDSIITEADRLFGISMQDGISKITSLKL
jgi:chromosome segregation protein